MTIAGRDVGREVTVTVRPRQLEDVSRSSGQPRGELWAALVPAGFNDDLFSTQLVAYSGDPTILDTVQQALASSQTLRVTVRDTLAGWWIQDCEVVP
jgi:hypothetical protein